MSKPLGVSIDDAICVIEWMAGMEEERARELHNRAAKSTSDFTADDLSEDARRHLRLVVYLRGFKKRIGA